MRRFFTGGQGGKRPVGMSVVEQRAGSGIGFCQLAVFYKAGKNAVIPAWVSVKPAALQRHQRAGQQRQVQLTRHERCLLVFGLAFACEELRQVALLLREQIDGEEARAHESLVAIGIFAQAEEDQRRLQREAAKGAGGKAPGLALLIARSNDRDSAGEPGHRPLKILRTNHMLETSTGPGSAEGACSRKCGMTSFAIISWCLRTR